MRVRNRQLKGQDGLCYYCAQPMWIQDINGFCRQYQVNPAEALFLKCTAEHLIARKDGGLDTDANIVAACHYCNQSRHADEDALDPDEFRQYVKTELGAGRWHQLLLNTLTD